MSVPEVSEEVVTAYRGWQLLIGDDESVQLRSLIQQHIWTPRVRQEASCSYKSACVAPEVGHSCGFYGGANEQNLGYWYHGWKKGVLRQDGVTHTRYSLGGLCSLWGKLIKHQYGWRAQYAYPYEIWVPSAPFNGEYPIDIKKIVKHLRQAYLCDIVVKDLSKLPDPKETRNSSQAWGQPEE